MINPPTTTCNPTAALTLNCNSTARFRRGQVVASPGALRVLQQTGFGAAALISRHVRLDGGDLCKEDRTMNEDAVAKHVRVLSCYRLVKAERLAATQADKRSSLPITEADRSVTTLPRPDEY